MRSGAVMLLPCICPRLWVIFRVPGNTCLKFTIHMTGAGSEADTKGKGRYSQYLDATAELSNAAEVAGKLRGKRQRGWTCDGSTPDIKRS